MKWPAVFWVWIAIAPLRCQSLGDGIAAVKAGRPDLAIRILSSVVQRDANSSEANFYLGLAHFRSGNSGEARPFLKRAVALAPKDAQAWKILGLATTSQGDMAAATEPLRNACTMAPGDEDACYYFARNLFALGQYEAARAPFELALRAAPANMAARVQRAIAMNYVALNLPVQAEQHFVSAVRLANQSHGPDDPRVDYGAFLFRQGRLPEALRTLEPPAHVTPPSARANLEFGRALLHAGRVAEAAACLEKTVGLEPKDFAAHLLLGRAYMMLGKTAEGERELKLGQEGWAAKR